MSVESSYNCLTLLSHTNDSTFWFNVFLLTVTIVFPLSALVTIRLLSCTFFLVVVSNMIVFFFCGVKFQICVYYPYSQITEFISFKKKRPKRGCLDTTTVSTANNSILYFNYNTDCNNCNI
jgi:hypothetical protein